MRMTAEKAGKKGLYILAGIVAMVYMLLFGGNAMVSYAAEIRTITDAKIRSEADTGSAQVGSAPQGTTLSVLGETQGADNNTWYQVSVDGQTGYIRKDLTEDVDGGSEASGTVAQTDITSGVIGGSSVTVRKGPSTSAGKAAGAEAGATVRITGEALGDDGSTWYQVDVDGQSGFIRSDLFDEAGFAREGGEEGIPEGEGEGGEETPEEPAEGGEESPEAAEGGTKVVNVLSSKVIPDGVDIEDMEIDADTLAGWVSDEYYLLKTREESGNEDYYIYVLSTGKLEKLKLAGSGSFSSLMDGSGKFIVIGVGVLVVILIIVCIMLAVKLRGYQEYDGYSGGRGRRSYDDDDDDEEEYDDDEYDDDEEYDDEEEYDDDDEEEYDDDEEEYDDDEEEYDDDEEEYDDDEEEYERPVKKRRWSPKNFLSRREEYEEDEDDEEEYEDEDDDEDGYDDEEYLDDDDFEFEFLNMDGKDDF